MSQRGGASGLKRKRPGFDDLKPDELNLYNLIKSKGNMGIWKGDIRKELNIVTNAKIIDSCIKSLSLKQMIKEVSNVRAKGKKRLMAMEVEPSKEITGGMWYNDQGELDETLIGTLKMLCLKMLTKQKVATADGLRHEIKRSEIVKVDLTVEQVKEILDNLILEKEVVRVKSNGMGELASFPINADCYKIKSKPTKVGTFASIPCGVCPRINHCAPDGIISPVSCVYYTRWLEF